MPISSPIRGELHSLVDVAAQFLRKGEALDARGSLSSSRSRSPPENERSGATPSTAKRP